MTALADWLLYDHPVGIPLVLAVLLLSTAVVLTRARRCHGQILRAAIILLIALLPFVEAPGIIAFAFLAGGTAYFALAAALLLEEDRVRCVQVLRADGVRERLAQLAGDADTLDGEDHSQDARGEQERTRVRRRKGGVRSRGSRGCRPRDGAPKGL